MVIKALMIETRLEVVVRILNDRKGLGTSTIVLYHLLMIGSKQ